MRGGACSSGCVSPTHASRRRESSEFPTRPAHAGRCDLLQHASYIAIGCDPEVACALGNVLASHCRELRDLWGAGATRAPNSTRKAHRSWRGAQSVTKIPESRCTYRSRPPPLVLHGTRTSTARQWSATLGRPISSRAHQGVSGVLRRIGSVRARRVQAITFEVEPEAQGSGTRLH